MWLTQSGILGASPDGLVGETDIIEVKCPYRWRDSTFAEAVKDKSFYLKLVNKCHSHYQTKAGFSIVILAGFLSWIIIYFNELVDFFI